MIRLKTEKQINGIRESCKMLSAMFRELVPLVKPGIITKDIDMWVFNWIKKSGGKPAFLGYGQKKTPYPASICISINNEVIHGIPSRYRIMEGDLVSLDCGIDLGGFFSDQALSIEAGKVKPEIHQLNLTTRDCLNKAINAVKPGDRIHQVSRAIQGFAEARGYNVVHEFCGHGVGFDLHEDPQVPNVSHGSNPRMCNGLVIAIEPMVNMGTGDVNVLDDGWTVVTADDSISAHWEHTVAIFADRVEVLTDPLDQWLK